MARDKKIPILLFSSSLNIGGTERNVVKIAKQIDKNKFDPEVFCLFGTGPLESELRESGVAYSFGYFGRIFDLRVYVRTIKALKRNNYEVLHCFGYPTIYFGVLLGYFVGIRNIIVAIQALDTWKSKVHVLLDRLIRPFTTQYIADSYGARRCAIKRQGIMPEKITTIYDGVDLSSMLPTRGKQELKEGLGIPNNAPVVGVIARLQDEHKGQSYFVKAIPFILKEFPDARFVIVGDGADRSWLERLCEDIGVKDKVIFTGFRTDLANIISIIDILVIPSIQWESITKTMLETMSMGRPIVATDIGDIGEILKDGETGILIPPRDPSEIAAAVINLLKNPDYAERIGCAGKAAIKKLGLVLEESTRKVEDIYISLCVNRKAISFQEKLMKTAYFYIVFLTTALLVFVFMTVEGIYKILKKASHGI